MNVNSVVTNQILVDYTIKFTEGRKASSTHPYNKIRVLEIRNSPNTSSILFGRGYFLPAKYCSTWGGLWNFFSTSLDQATPSMLKGTGISVPPVSLLANLTRRKVSNLIRKDIGLAYQWTCFWQSNHKGGKHLQGHQSYCRICKVRNSSSS